MKNKIALSSTLREEPTVRLKIKVILIFFLAGLFGHGNILIAQDYIILKNGDEIKSSVIEIGIDLIKYRKFENPTGPIYNLEKSKIFMIKYENGTKDIFTTVPDTQPKPIPKIEAETYSSSSGKPLVASGARIMQGGVRLSSREVRRLLSPYPESLHSYNSGRVLNGWSDAFGYAAIGVFVVVIVSDEGLGTAFVSMLPFGIAEGVFALLSQKKINSSVTLYNSSKNKQISYKLNFGIQGNGVGFALNF